MMGVLSFPGEECRRGTRNRLQHDGMLFSSLHSLVVARWICCFSCAAVDCDASVVAVRRRFGPGRLSLRLLRLGDLKCFCLSAVVGISNILGGWMIFHEFSLILVTISMECVGCSCYAAC